MRMAPSWGVGLVWGRMDLSITRVGLQWTRVLSCVILPGLTLIFSTAEGNSSDLWKHGHDCVVHMVLLLCFRGGGHSWSQGTCKPVCPCSGKACGRAAPCSQCVLGAGGQMHTHPFTHWRLISKRPFQASQRPWWQWSLGFYSLVTVALLLTFPHSWLSRVISQIHPMHPSHCLSHCCQGMQIKMCLGEMNLWWHYFPSHCALHHSPALQQSFLVIWLCEL